jgi:hypothetical protein
MEARDLVKLIPVSNVLGSDEEKLAEEFERGISDALYLEDLDEDTDHSEIEHLKSHVRDYGMCEHSPLVLDLDGDGLSISSVKEGVSFDLLDRGKTVRSAWPNPGDALLVYDRNGNGQIESGAELFGNTTAENGFLALAELELESGNGDGIVDARDASYEVLKVWRDDNRNALSEPGELFSLAELGITSIQVQYTELSQRDSEGNRLDQWAHFTRVRDGVCESLDIADVWACDIAWQGRTLHPP